MHIGDDIGRLSRVACTDEKTCRFILGYYFNNLDGTYKHKRIDEELEKAQARRDASIENGKKGGRPAKNNLEKTHRLSVGKPRPNLEKTSSSSSSSSSKDIDTSVSIDKQFYNTIKTRFESEQPQQRFTSYPKEGKAIHGLIDKAMARAPDDPATFLEGMIRTFEYLRETDKFYKGQPFLPSALNSSGIWDRVLNYAGERWKEEQAAKVVDVSEVPL